MHPPWTELGGFGGCRGRSPLCHHLARILYSRPLRPRVGMRLEGRVVWGAREGEEQRVTVRMYTRYVAPSRQPFPEKGRLFLFPLARATTGCAEVGRRVLEPWEHETTC